MTIYTCAQLPMISRYCSLSSDLVGGFLQLFFVGTQTRAQTSKGIGRSWHHWVANLLCRFQGIRYLKDAHKYYTARIVNTCYNTLKYTINLRWLCRMYHLSLIGYRKKMIFFFFFLLLVSYWLHSDTGCNLLIDLHQFVSKELSVLCGHDGLHWGSQDLYSIFLQDATLE